MGNDVTVKENSWHSAPAVRKYLPIWRHHEGKFLINTPLSRKQAFKSHFCLGSLATVAKDEKHRLPTTVVAENWQIDRFRHEEYTNTTPDNRQARGGCCGWASYPKKSKLPEWVEIWHRWWGGCVDWKYIWKSLYKTTPPPSPAHQLSLATAKAKYILNYINQHI